MSSISTEISTDRNLHLVNDIKDDACGLFEFTNECEAVQVGFLCWIQSETDEQDPTYFENLISNKTEMVVFWPNNCDVAYASIMIKRVKKSGVEWGKWSARLLAYGNWVEMCAKRNYYINHDDMSPSRSKRKERHKLHLDLPKNSNADIVKKTSGSKLKRKFAALSSSEVLKKLKNKKNECDSDINDDHKLTIMSKNVIESSDDEIMNFQLSKSSKDELIMKINMLEEKNKELRLTVARQRTMLDMSEMIPKINRLSKRLLDNLNCALDLTDKKLLVKPASKENTVIVNNIVQQKQLPSSSLSKNVSEPKNQKITENLVLNDIIMEADDKIQIFNEKSVVNCTDTIQDLDEVLSHIENNDYSISNVKTPENSIDTYQQKINESTSKQLSHNLQIKQSNTGNWIELWPGSGIEVNEFALRSINRKSPSKMIADLMIILFTDDELRHGSVTGKKSNFTKIRGEALTVKQKLDDKKVKAMKDFTLSIFKDVDDKTIQQAMRTKLNNISKKPKTADDISTGSASRLKTI